MSLGPTPLCNFELASAEGKGCAGGSSAAPAGSREHAQAEGAELRHRAGAAAGDGMGSRQQGKTYTEQLDKTHREQPVSVHAATDVCSATLLAVLFLIGSGPA